jgi:hypothetical protein
MLSGWLPPREDLETGAVESAPRPAPDAEGPVLTPEVVAKVPRAVRPAAIDCPQCGAPAGAFCDRRTLGSKKRHFHLARVAAADALVEGQ